jgi:CheY-like chemotaxis protein
MFLFWHKIVVEFGMKAKGAIIIIEDDPDDQLILGETLKELGVESELCFFNDCDKAYSYLMSITEKPFLILCDINLPRMNGIELKRKIDETDRLRALAIPFVFLTTSDSAQTINAAYRITNLQGYFQKSNTDAALKKTLKCILEYWSCALHPNQSH